MNVKEWVPSFLKSWVLWRNYYTSDLENPFGVLKDELETDDIPSKAEYLIYNNNDCPFCRLDGVVRDKDNNKITCICELLEQISNYRDSHRQISTNVPSASLSEIVYPLEMGRIYKDSMSKAVEAAKDFIIEPQKWILYMGRVGIGKTHILKAINSAFKPISLYISAGDLEQKVHEYRKMDALGDLYEALIKAPVLLLDDLGMEYGGALVKSAVDKIIDARYEKFQDRATVIATNLKGFELKTYIPRASDRIIDQAITRVFAISSDKSFRKLELRDRV
jgi:energy-coupling factor transporter ATP-binding protein EcfA2